MGDHRNESVIQGTQALEERKGRRVPKRGRGIGKEPKAAKQKKSRREAEF